MDQSPRPAEGRRRQRRRRTKSQAIKLVGGTGDFHHRNINRMFCHRNPNDFNSVLHDASSGTRKRFR
jgi:hypothetical protein